MILSHSHRFIFIKTRKTAGSSLQAYLKTFLDPERDIVTALDDDEGFNWQGTALEIRPGKGLGHAHIGLVLEAFPEARDYFKFSIERNPWDKCVSQWHWFQKSEKWFGVSFPEFLQRGVLPTDWARYTVRGFPAVDEVLRFESFESGIPQLGEQIGLPLKYEDFSEYRLKSEHRPRTDYKHYYTDETRERVASYFRNEIGHFGYEFRPAPSDSDLLVV